VDCVEGVCIQTETVTRQALAERVKPVLHINKVDRAILELQLEPEELYQQMSRVIESVNVVLSTYSDSLLGDVQVNPLHGNVSFGSGKQGWAFNLPMFARAIAKKNKRDPDKILSRLWGNYFIDPKTGKISKQKKEGYERVFCKMILDPIYSIFHAIKNKENEKLDKMLKSLDISLTKDERELPENDLLSCVMQKFLPAGDALAEMIIEKLPSPAQAQKYRVDNLYLGPQDDATAQAIRNCDPNGPLTIFISKMVPGKNFKSFYAYGRVFSGTARRGQTVYIMSPEYKHGEKEGLTQASLSTVVLMMGKSVESMDEIPCGNTIGIQGIDKYLLKSGTLSSVSKPHPIAPMAFSVSPVVSVAIKSKQTSDRKALNTAIDLLIKTDPCLQGKVDKNTGEHILSGAGELHLDTALNELRDEYLGPDVEIEISDPVVSFCETVVDVSETALAKSGNKHNRIFMRAQPLSEGLAEEIESGKVSSRDIPKERTSYLTKQFKWDKNEANKIVGFGPDRHGPNILTDCTVGAQYLKQTLPTIDTGFQSATSNGILCGEPLRGIKFSLMDVRLHEDSVHRSVSQIVPATRRACYASMLMAKPRLLEPVFLVQIVTSRDASGPIFSLLSKKRGYVFEEVAKEGTPLVTIKAYLPVLEGFGFSADLRAATSGKAFPQMKFDHWQVMDGDPLVEGSKAHEVVMEVRRRKKMKPELPKLEDYLDSLNR